MWHSRPTPVFSQLSISKDGWKYYSVDYYHYCHAHPHQLWLRHPLTVVQRQSSIVYHYNFNHNTTKAKPLYEARDPSPATRYSKACEHSYNKYSRKKNRPLQRFRSFKISRQSTQGCYNAPLPMCRIQPTPSQYIRNSYPVALVVNWITSTRY